MFALIRMAVASILLGIVATGCATPTLAKAECETADWRAIGYADGAAGYRAERIAKHREACARFGVSPDLVAYNQGRADGLGEYCTVPAGLAFGRDGHDCAICANFPNVLVACRHGKRIRATDQAIAAVEWSIAQADSAIAEARTWTPEDALAGKLKRIDKDISSEQREIDSRISRNEERFDLDLERSQRHSDARVGHERNRENLVIENSRKLSENAEAKAANEERLPELHGERAALLKEADALR